MDGYRSSVKLQFGRASSLISDWLQADGIHHQERLIMIDWKSEIARMTQWKQAAAERDKFHILPWHLPRIAASDDAISAAELASDIEFPDELKGFLRHADFILLQIYLERRNFYLARPKMCAPVQK